MLTIDRWTVKYHLCAAVAVLGCLAFAAYYMRGYQAGRLVDAKKSLSEAQQVAKLSGLDAAKNLPIKDVKDFTFKLPDVAKSDDVLKEMSRLASEKAIPISSIKVMPHAANKTELGWVQYDVNLRTDYSLFKNWLGGLLGRYASLSVKTLTIRSIPNDNSKQEINLSLQFFVKN
jgi:hypothetical protein